MKRLWLCLAMLVCALVLAAAGTEKNKGDEEPNEGFKSLGRNIRLDFKAVPLNPGDNGVFIITASPEYETSVRLEGNAGKIEFEVSGKVKLLDGGRIFVHYSAHALLTNKEGEAEYRMSSGVVLKPGQELGVSRMGEKIFVISASYVKEEKASEKKETKPF